MFVMLNVTSDHFAVTSLWHGVTLFTVNAGMENTALKSTLLLPPLQGSPAKPEAQCSVAFLDKNQAEHI